ncbi:putative membrane protein YeiH [Arthrobacter silviterrae]|uniref:Trimeric intracellular cation channel family protein n=1 Tax=Arthrobacter silviterrae TaxID=2026658 RepID=A0ABX0DAD6_9MICC|nr:MULTISPECIES: TRIC cation channel family protein [Arthrobacter]MCU6479754.1 TRIC cation channel family protein [Arthrobacter sp. A2-55]MDQ0277786.1 putative membrane protein YeiH [Arthrobacter silviterrae]NGN83848.1 trimeric intracellular cation channel family protein [Arthrobacter silviterrae]
MPLNLALMLDLLGVFFFAVSGSLLAARKGFDLVGSVLLGSLVGLGGGVVRDLVLNAGPPAAFSNPVYMLPPLLAAAVVYFLVGGVERVSRLVLTFDAGGLALFCITGTLKALDAGMNAAAALLLGVTTAVGGGILRDVTANRVPRVFDPQDLYAIPAFLGAGLATALWHLGWLNLATGTAAAVVVFVLRMLALKFKWHAPLAARSWASPRWRRR